MVSACFVSARGRVTREPRRCRWTRTRSETARLGRDDARHARSATRTRDFSKPEPCRDRVIRVLASRARLGGRNDRPVVRRRARGFSRAESVENRETDAGRLRAVPGSAMGCLPERRAEMRAGRATPEMQEIAAILKTVVCVFMPHTVRGGRARWIAKTFTSVRAKEDSSSRGVERSDSSVRISEWQPRSADKTVTVFYTHYFWKTTTPIFSNSIARRTSDTL